MAAPRPPVIESAGGYAIDIDRQRRINAIAQAALELPAGERTAHVGQACGDDGALAAGVVRLLEASRAAEAHDFLGFDAGAAPAELDGDHRYRIVREIGRGGMGVVYLGERADGEFQRRVAIKLIHVDSALDPDASRRFRSERQILADLEHPHIARLLDGGTLADGRPFLVMEYIDGLRIDQWCDERGLDREARVRLFLQVCAAVAHAHRHLVVHRDLKPGNVLVDARGDARLLDFGIAKLLAGDTGPATVTQERLLTVAYASPEQVRGGGVGTASDVYSLAVLLYRLLTGRLPYRAAEDSVAALARAICDDPPAPPSERAARSDLPTARARLRMDSDLDHILLKALRKEPEQRYRSVDALADDLQRWLDGLPVLARRGSRTYRLAKFVRRHALATAAAAAVLVLVVGFGIDRQRQLAATRAERDRAEHLVELMTGLFENADPEKSGGRKVVVADVLDVAARRAQSDAGQQPLDRAAMLHTLGEVYRTLGDFERARRLLEQARDLRAGVPGAELAAADSDIALGVVLQHQREFDRAEAQLRRALPVYAQALGTDHWRTVQTAARLALLTRERGDFAAAQTALEAALASMLRGLRLEAVPAQIDGNAPRDGVLALAWLLHGLGQTAHDRKDWTHAQPWLEQSLVLRRHLLARNDPVLTQTMTVLANVARERGDLQAALRLREEVLAIREQAYGPGHWQVGIALVNLGDGYGALGRYDDARRAAERAEQVFTATLGPNHPYTLIALGNQATANSGDTDLPHALALSEEVLKRRRAVLPADHPDVALALYQIASLLAQMQRWQQALDRYDEAFAIYAQQYGADHPYLDENRVSEAEALGALGRATEAETRLRAVLAHDGHADANPTVVALAKFRLAQHLDANADADATVRAEAVRLAREAAATGTREGRSDLLDPAEIDAWLAAHAAAAPP